MLKGDIRKFFANIDHRILKETLAGYIPDKKILRLLDTVIDSFSTDGNSGVGLPLGNLTSQLLVNVYMNEFDQYMKHVVREKYYIRYADDFVVLSNEKVLLENLIPLVERFLSERLRLTLHPDKLFISSLASGVDFLGWVHFPDHSVLRSATRRRMLRRLKENNSPETLASYRGLLVHGNARILEQTLDQYDSLQEP